MVWSLMENESFKWPKELDPGTYKAAEKAGKIKDVLKKLDDAEKTFKGIDFPYQWITSNPITHLNWQNHALNFLKGPAKNLTGLLAGIKSAADKAANDKGVTGSADSKAAVLAIAKAANAHMKYVQPGELEVQIDKINALCGEAYEAEIQKKTGVIKKACRALTSSRHPKIAQGSKLVLGAEKSKTRDDDLDKAADVLAEGATEIVDLIDDLIKAKKAKNAPVKGLTDSDYNLLARVRVNLKPFTKDGWTKKNDLKVMQQGVKSMKAQSGFFDQVVRKMVSK